MSSRRKLPSIVKTIRLDQVPDVMGKVPENWTESGWISHIRYIAENATFKDVRQAYASALEKLENSGHKRDDTL